MVALAGDEAVGTWNQVEVLMCQWRAIEVLLDKPAPFVSQGARVGARATRSDPARLQRARVLAGVW
jgi:hypothetical protein